MSKGFIMSSGGGGITMKKLWTNAKPSSSFASQTISLTMSGYDYIRISFAYSDSNNAISSVIEIKNTANATGRGSAFELWKGGYLVATRDVTLKSNGVTFGGGNSYQSDSPSKDVANNYMCIPIEIYGIKGVS